MAGAPLLRIESVTRRFRGLVAVNGVSFDVAAGEIVTLIGPNGAGKTTLFNLIAGMLKPDRGSVTFAGRLVTGLAPERLCHAGIGRTFQTVRPFAGMTVEDNVVVGALHAARTVREARTAAGALLERMDLAEQRRRPAGTLTLPDRKRLEVARALATRPKLLLLDEVMAGLRPAETDRMVALFRALNREDGLTILLIEHVMRAVMALAGRIVVLHHGEKIAEGAPEAVVNDPRVQDCYLGREAV